MITVAGYSNLQSIYQSTRTLVWSARRKSDGTPVVLRQLRPEVVSPELVARYRREYELLQRVDSDFVIRAIDLVEQSNSTTLVTESIGGTSVASMLDSASLAVREVLNIAIAATRGLDDLHAEHIIHKNINPGNLVYNSSTGQVRIIDLGIATLSPTAVTTEPPTHPEGTLSYIAPEQTGRLNRFIDYRADFYALGATIYELLTGSPPFTSDDSLELVYKHLATPATPLHKLDASIPIGLSNVVARLLAKMPEDRYQSTFAIDRDLQRCVELLDQPDDGLEQTFEVALDDIPEQLYISERLLDRGPQLTALRDALGQMTGGGTVVVACAGEAGTGKSSLIRELQKDVAAHHGFLITARHHHLSGEQPYGGISSACSDLVRQLLARADIDRIRGRVAHAVGHHALLLCQLAPELRLLLDKDTPFDADAEPVPPAEARRTSGRRPWLR
ncbi:MAG: serine/threonine-protein kinase [Gammaproteobacteria bacterium]|nr:serine/threonine-protein kinase [Gammaproteobacteria bacterium]